MTARDNPTFSMIATLVLLTGLLLAVALAACTTDERARIEVAAEYVRASVTADYAALADVVASDARPYVLALESATPQGGNLATLGDESWEDGALTIELGFGAPSAYIKLSPPTDQAPDDVVVNSWNDVGDEASGTMTVEYEDDRLVVTAVDGTPIAEVLSAGRSLW